MSEKDVRAGRALIFYHYFYPDDVVSAQHYSHLAEDLSARGWEVTVLTTNRARHDTSIKYPARETWNGVDIRRIWRPAFSQDAMIKRFITAFWVAAAWALAAFRKRSIPDVDLMIIGTDPVMSISCIPVWKLVRPRIKVVFWCFDLFPDIAVEGGMLSRDSFVFRMITRFCKWIYGFCDLIVDTASCQRRRLRAYDGDKTRQATCTPWATVEPPEVTPIDRDEREEVFGDAKLALLYSGNFGRAHGHDLIIELARRLRDSDARLVFGIRGSRADAVKESIAPDDTNIHFDGFVPMERLQARLSTPDVHLLSLRPEWTGTLVPSKFFGALAIGRPVIFYGSPDSAIAEWINEYQLGWVLTPDTLDSVVDDLARLSSDPEALAGMRERCYRAYQDHFSRTKVMDTWHQELVSLLES